MVPTRGKTGASYPSLLPPRSKRSPDTNHRASGIQWKGTHGTNVRASIPASSQTGGGFSAKLVGPHVGALPLGRTSRVMETSGIPVGAITWEQCRHVQSAPTSTPFEIRGQTPFDFSGSRDRQTLNASENPTLQIY